MFFFPVKIGVVCRHAIDELREYLARGVCNDAVVIGLVAFNALRLEEFLQTADDQGAFSVVQGNPETIINKGADLIELLICDFYVGNSVAQNDY